MKIYISGAITGNDNAEKEFTKAEERLRIMGHTPVNPFKIKAKGTSWADYMKADIKELLKCDAIYMLEGWKKSKGARLENSIAEQLGILVANV